MPNHTKRTVLAQLSIHTNWFVTDGMADCLMARVICFAVGKKVWEKLFTTDQDELVSQK
jgi:hypothetical protein